jgi:hypothetical protein
MANLYNIGISIALANGVSPVLAIIAHDLLRLNTSVNQITNNFSQWSRAIGGVASILGGTAILGGMHKIIKAGAEVVHQQELLKLAGATNEEQQIALSKAYEISAKVQTTNIADNLKHLRELRYAFGDMDKAAQFIEKVTKANAVLGSVKGDMFTDQVWELVKSLEQKGETINPDTFNEYIDVMQKATIASGGKVTPQEFFQAFKYGRIAMLGWDKEFIGMYLPRLIQSMTGGGGGGGGGRGGPGNALMSAFAKVVQGQMPKTAAEQFRDLGLATEYQAIPGSSKSQIRIFGSELFQHNPYRWVQEVLMPALAKHNITSQEQILETVSRLFPVRTASQVIAELALQGEFRLGNASQFSKDAILANKAMATNPAYEELIKYDPDVVMKAFTEQWKSMIQALGAPMVQPALGVMSNVTDIFTSIAQFAGRNPAAIETIGKVFAAIAVGLVAIGGVALASLISIPAAIIGLAAAIGTLAYLEWDKIKAGFNWIINWFKTWISSWGLPHANVAPGTPLAPNDFAHRFTPKFQKERWDYMPNNPGAKPIQIHTQLHIDGRKFAEAVSLHTARLHEFPTRGAFVDGLGSFQSPDSQTVTT